MIDDETHCIETLRYELERSCPEVEIVDTATSGQEGIQKITQHSPDLIFLDIEMPGMNGFEMLRQLGNIDGDVIFVTAYDQYAIQAFQFSAIDYLLKPVVSEKLTEAIEKVNNRLSRNQNKQLKALLHNLQFGAKSPRIALPSGRGLDIVDVENISHCIAESNYTHFQMQDGRKYLMSKTLKDIDDLLSNFNFFRIHQSYLVNMQHIQRYVRDDGGYVIMVCGEKIPIAKRRKEEFMKLLRG